MGKKINKIHKALVSLIKKEQAQIHKSRNDQEEIALNKFKKLKEMGKFQIDPVALQCFNEYIENVSFQRTVPIKKHQMQIILQENPTKR